MSESSVTAYIGLGANLGDARETLEAALQAIEGFRETELRRVSSWYRTAPIDASGPDFLNLVAEIETTLGPEALLAQLQNVEQAHGRERPYRNAPRTLDLDLLLYGDSTIDAPALVVPHPRLHRRAFVLKPLAELAPGLKIPGCGAIDALLAGVTDQEVERLPEPAPEPSSAAAGLARWRYIVIEGPIGVGKSTLAKRLAQHLGAELMLERPQDNPFLERFYADPTAYAFQTQLYFLFQRQEQMRELSQPGMFTHGVVSDFLFDKDALFAALTLSVEEFRLYTLIHRQAAVQLPRPDLVIWLQARPATLMERVRRRGLAMELGITPDYLTRIADAYGAHFQRYDAAPLLAVDTEYFNPASRDADFERLLRRLDAFEGPREFFDPIDDELLS